jgi:hypothetical protein
MSFFTPEYFSHFTDSHVEVVNKLRGCFGDEAMTAMLSHANTLEKQQALIQSFVNSQSVTADIIKSRAEQDAAFVIAQGEDDRLRLQQRVDSLTGALVDSTQTRSVSRTPAPRPMKLFVPPYTGLASEHLVRWIMQVEIGAKQMLTSNDEDRIDYAMSYLAGLAADWAWTKRQTNAGCFRDWDDFVAQLRGRFSHPNSDFQSRAKFISCKQGSRKLAAYIQELQALNASLADPAWLAEVTKVTVFMEGLNKGSTRNQLFRVFPKTLEEAFNIALQEDYSVRSAGGPASDDMDISAIQTELNALRAQFEQRDISKVKCFRCGRAGHMRSTCRVRLPPAAPGAPYGGPGSQGNANSQ